MQDVRVLHTALKNEIKIQLEYNIDDGTGGIFGRSLEDACSFYRLTLSAVFTLGEGTGADKAHCCLC